MEHGGRVPASYRRCVQARRCMNELEKPLERVIVGVYAAHWRRR